VGGHVWFAPISTFSTSATVSVGFDEVANSVIAGCVRDPKDTASTKRPAKQTSRVSPADQDCGKVVGTPRCMEETSIRLQYLLGGCPAQRHEFRQKPALSLRDRPGTLVMVRNSRAGPRSDSPNPKVFNVFDKSKLSSLAQAAAEPMGRTCRGVKSSLIVRGAIASAILHSTSAPSDRRASNLSRHSPLLRKCKDSRQHRTVGCIKRRRHVLCCASEYRRNRRHGWKYRLAALRNAGSLLRGAIIVAFHESRPLAHVTAGNRSAFRA